MAMERRRRSVERDESDLHDRLGAFIVGACIGVFGGALFDVRGI